MDRKNIIKLTRSIHGKEEGKPSSPSSFEGKMLDMALRLYIHYMEIVSEYKGTTSMEEAAKWAWEALDVFMKEMPGNDKFDCR